MDLACCIAANARSRSGELWGRSGSGCGAGVGVLGAAGGCAGSSAGGVD
ncbi:hypothetical protein FACS189483_11360 [Spirochaetia bacterium]|nr:hypothetical protein FACS189483_11360 [Spirochaetia bacterium]